MSTAGSHRIASGRVFQTRGPATAKARLPSEERREWWVVAICPGYSDFELQEVERLNRKRQNYDELMPTFVSQLWWAWLTFAIFIHLIEQRIIIIIQTSVKNRTCSRCAGAVVIQQCQTVLYSTTDTALARLLAGGDRPAGRPGYLTVVTDDWAKAYVTPVHQMYFLLCSA